MKRLKIPNFGIPILTACLLALLVADVNAQSYNFNNYSVAEGLPNNQINDLFQDKRGNLWVATMYGVCRFDGQKFHQFERSNEIAINPVKTIFEDSQENLWFGTIRKGICKYDGTNFTWYTSDDGLLSDNVNAIAEDRDGNIWIGTSEGLSKFNGELFQNYTTLGGLIDNNVYELYIDKLNNVWVGTLGGISKLTGNSIANYTTDNGLFSNIIYDIMETSSGMLLACSYRGVSRFSSDGFQPYISMRELPETRVQDMTEDYNGNLWLATNGDGVIKYNKHRIEYLNILDGLPHNNVTKVLEDREGNFWFGTKTGLSKYSGDRFTTYTVEDGISENNIQSIFSDSKGRIWLGTLSEGVNIFRNGDVVRNISTSEGLKSNTIWSIVEGSAGDFWIGTTSGVARVSDENDSIDFPFPQLDNLIIHAMLEDKNGQYLFGTDEGLYIFAKGRFRVIDEEDGLKNIHIRSLYEDHKGDIWVGTLKGVYVITSDGIIDFNDQFEIIKAPVTSIIEDRNGNIICSTYDYGVIAYIRSRDIDPFSITSYSGFISDRILFNFLDRRGQLWLGTPDGIDCIDWDHFANGGDISLNHFDKYNGYYGVETNAAVEDSTGNVWFGTVNGVIRYNSSSGKIKIAKPQTNITNIKLFLEDVDWDSLGINRDIKTRLPISPVLAHNQNYLSFEFVGIYLTAPDEIKYRFMLEGFEEDWSPLSNQTIAHYSNLGPGEYTFKVEASPNEALWSETEQFSFVIEAPFWKTPLFFVLYVLVGAGIVWFFLKMRTRSLQRARNFLQQKVDDRTRELNETNVELAKLSLVASETDNAVLIFNKQRKLEWVNEGFTKMTGYSLSDIKGSGTNAFDLDSYRGNLIEQLDVTINERKSHIYEGLIESAAGEKIWTSSTFTPIYDDNNDLKNVVVIDTDISLRKKMEDQIKASLDEKGVLLREIHHRVKNNLQIIISLFNLQSNYISNKNALRVLREGQDRIKSMALIHERFYQSDGLSKIDFDDYIYKLTENLFLSYVVDTRKINLAIQADKVSVDIDTAVPCGLIINELVSNSLKHAFESEESGEIFIRFRELERNIYKLVVGDTGKGVEPDFDFENTETLGMQLVSALTDQLDGKMDIVRNNGQGIAFEIQFKKADN